MEDVGDHDYLAEHKRLNDREPVVAKVDAVISEQQPFVGRATYRQSSPLARDASSTTAVHQRRSGANY